MSQKSCSNYERSAGTTKTLIDENEYVFVYQRLGRARATFSRVLISSEEQH